MQAGLSTYAFPWAISIANTPAQQFRAGMDLLQFAHTHDIRHIQFGDNIPLHKLEHEDLKKLQQSAMDLQLQIEVGARGLKQDHLLRYLSLAQRFQSPFVRIVIDDEGYEPDEKNVIAIIKTVLPQYGSSGVYLAIENHDRFPAKTLRNIVECTDPQWVAVCLDTANSIGAGEGIREVASLLAPYTINLHIKDIIIKRVGSKMGFTVEGCPAGQGQLPLPEIITAVKKYNRCNTATLEVWSNAANSLEATIKQERAWVEKSIDYLKTILA